jgi:ArsR family transcriptional regulator
MARSLLSREHAALLFHALSDPTRLEILERLKGGEQCVCELMEVMKAAQSRLSFHLRVLKEAGLLHDRREGRWMYYSVNPEGVEELEDWVAELKHITRATGSSRQCC